MLNGTLGLISPIMFLVTILGLLSMLIFQKNKLGKVFVLFLGFISVYLFFGSLSVFDLSLTFGDYITEVTKYAKSMLILILFYFFFKNSDKNSGLENQILFIAILLTITNATIFFMDYYELSVRLTFDDKIIKDKWARASGVWGNANTAAAYCILNIILWMYISLKQNIIIVKRLLIYSIILFLVYSIYLTLSNTAFIIVIPIIFIYINVFTDAISFKTKAKIIGVGIVGVILFSFMFSSSIYKQYENLTPKKKEKIENILTFFKLGDNKEVSFSDRDITLKKGFEKIKNKPIRGNGLGSFKKNLHRYDGIHNLYIQILGEGGLFPFLFFLFFLCYLLNQVLLTKRKETRFFLFSFFLFIALYGLTTHGVFLVKGYGVFLSLFFVLLEKQKKIYPVISNLFNK